MKKTFTIGVCEDVNEEANSLIGIIEKWANDKGFQINILLYNNADQFWFHYTTDSLDAIFLDIKMPGEDGMTLAKKLRKKEDRVPIVFVTGEQEYLADGYDVEAVHYLLKPVNAGKMFLCLDRIWSKLQQEEPFVLLQTNNSSAKIYQKDIYKIESFGHNIIYYTKQGEFNITSSLKHVEEQLIDGWFIQCFRGIIVGIRYIDMIEKTSLVLNIGENDCVDESGQRIIVPVSRRLYQKINEAFILFYKKMDR